jgi:hypothetical protein
MHNGILFSHDLNLVIYGKWDMTGEHHVKRNKHRKTNMTCSHSYVEANEFIS